MLLSVARKTLLLATLTLPALAQTTPLSWPPTLDSKSTVTQSTDGRAIEHYVHGPRKEWGYPADAKWDFPAPQDNDAHQQNYNSFYLVAPKVAHDNAPLCVVLHSANRTAYDYMSYPSLYKPTDPPDAKTSAITSSPDDFYALYLNSTNDEWWGWNQAQKNPNFAQHVNVPAPAELRVLDTIEWIVTKYKIDRNRIYLCGMSMGGCGTLGIGLPHGDIFAAALAAAPAGTEYAAYRTDSFKSPGATQPDPPAMVDFSSPVDGWSATQPALLLAAQTNHLPLVLSWGPFGHVGDTRLIGKYPLCAVTLAFPWLEIRRNEAYPAFTHASTDQTSPWLNSPAKFDESGQINAWFRWKNIADTSSHFAMQLWIAHPEISDHSLAMPSSATADLTLRRLQQFKLDPSKTYDWQLSRDGKSIASGKIKPDAVNLLTIPQVNLTTASAQLNLQADQ